MTSSASVVCPLTPVQIVPPRKNVEDTGGTYRTNPPAVRFRIPGMERMHSSERSIAVIGSGVAGLTAAYALSARDRVTLFEADTRIGGHAHTHYIDRGDGNIVGVDTAFLVHNDRTYPTLCRLFDDLGIATQETDMSMSVRDDGSRAGVRRRTGHRWAVPVLVDADPAALPGDAGRGQALPPRRRPGCCETDADDDERSARSSTGTASPATSSTTS